MSATIGFKLIERTDMPEGTVVKGYKIQLYADGTPPTLIAEKVIPPDAKVVQDSVEKFGGVIDWQKTPARVMARVVPIDQNDAEIDGTADYSAILVIEAPKTVSIMIPSETRLTVQ